jgi:UDP-glucose 4-epimerase
MAILVTGGAGYIGSHTCVELLSSGEEVVIVDNFSNSKPEAVRRIEFLGGKAVKLYEADILDKAALAKVFQENKIEAVIHFAGLKAVGESVEKPLVYYNNNVGGTLALCEVMAANGCKKIVFSSSATVYGPAAAVPYVETQPTARASSPYGNTKLMIEMILADLCVADPEWSVSLLRYFNPVGAHESGLLGEDPDDIPNNLMPYICRVAVGKLPFLRVYGDDYDTPDGTGVRDYLHVVDLATGHLAALDYVRKNRGTDAVNLGTGNGTSVLEVVRAFEAASGLRIPFEVEGRRAGDLAAYWADPSKAKRVLGWQATRTIEDMCRDCWRFMEKNPEGLQESCKL